MLPLRMAAEARIGSLTVDRRLAKVTADSKAFGRMTLIGGAELAAVFSASPFRRSGDFAMRLAIQEKNNQQEK